MTTQSGVYQCKVEFMGIKAESNNATLEVYGKCSLRIIGTSNTRATRCWVELFPKHFLAMSFFKTKWILKAQTLFQGTMIFFKPTSIIIVWFPVNNICPEYCIYYSSYHLFTFLSDPYPKVTASSGQSEHTVSENQAAGILLETFNLEAFKFSPKNEKATVKLQILSGKLIFFSR